MADGSVQGPPPVPYPRITIQFCTQCKWMLRAAYYAQELLSTFSVSIGEVALQPATGGTFVVTIVHSATAASSSDDHSALQSKVLWDRKVDGGFPETKELKRRVRDVIEPGRDLGHVDRQHGGGHGKQKQEDARAVDTGTSLADDAIAKGTETCEDCK